jgi:hypothetical protein
MMGVGVNALELDREKNMVFLQNLGWTVNSKEKGIDQILIACGH